MPPYRARLLFSTFFYKHAVPTGLKMARLLYVFYTGVRCFELRRFQNDGCGR